MLTSALNILRISIGWAINYLNFNWQVTTQKQNQLLATNQVMVNGNEYLPKQLEQNEVNKPIHSQSICKKLLTQQLKTRCMLTKPWKEMLTVDWKGGGSRTMERTDILAISQMAASLISGTSLVNSSYAASKASCQNRGNLIRRLLVYTSHICFTTFSLSSISYSFQPKISQDPGNHL